MLKNSVWRIRLNVHLLAIAMQPDSPRCLVHLSSKVILTWLERVSKKSSRRSTVHKIIAGLCRRMRVSLVDTEIRSRLWTGCARRDEVLHATPQQPLSRWAQLNSLRLSSTLRHTRFVIASLVTWREEEYPREMIRSIQELWKEEYKAKHRYRSFFRILVQDSWLDFWLLWRPINRTSLLTLFFADHL